MPLSPEALRTVAALTLVLQNITETFNYQLKKSQAQGSTGTSPKNAQGRETIKTGIRLQGFFATRKKLNNETIKNSY